MKRLWLLLLLWPLASQAQLLVDCDAAQITPCTLSPSSNTGFGDPAWLSFGKINANWLLIAPLFAAPTGTIVGNSGATGPVQNLTTLPFTLGVQKGGSGATSLSGPLKGNGTSPFSSAAAADISALWSGSCSSSTFLRGDGACASPGGTGTVTTTASPVSGNLAAFSGATSITSTDLSGDCTTAGTAAVTCLDTNGTPFGSFATQNYAAPPAIGGTTPAAAHFTTLSASSTVSGSGFTTYFASPPSIGNVAPGAGAFTTLSATTPVGVASGGTALASYTTGQILYASAATTLAGLSDVAAGSFLRSGGISTAPGYSTNTIPNTDSTGDIWYASAANTITALAGNTSTAKQFLSSTGTGSAAQAPAWGALAANDISTGLVFMQSGIPFIVPGTGSVGNNGALTLGTATPTGCCAKAYIWAKAGQIATGVPASAEFLYATCSSTTACTYFNNAYSSGNPTIPGSPTAFSTTGPGAYTGDTSASITGPNFSVAGNTQGVNGYIQIDGAFSTTSNSDVKQAWTFYGLTTNNCTLYYVAGTGTGGTGENFWYNQGQTGAQSCNFGGSNGGIGAPAYYAVDSTTAQTLGIAMHIGTATDDFILSGFSVKIYPH